eukprot:3748220-Pyramimonas_sp.AAC.1
MTFLCRIGQAIGFCVQSVIPSHTTPESQLSERERWRAFGPSAAPLDAIVGLPWDVSASACARA